MARIVHTFSDEDIPEESSLLKCPLFIGLRTKTNCWRLCLSRVLHDSKHLEEPRSSWRLRHPDHSGSITIKSRGSRERIRGRRV